MGKSGRVRFDLFDFYSGYSVFDKNGLKNEILNTKNLLVKLTPKILFRIHSKIVIEVELVIVTILRF
ncbi:hypothetical protein LEP1GSC083_1905 [Leptospira interrogans serovar Pyrogenes str. L0374]|uniref:Uncharacterized protein n=1 Tax=Leptospira interrogans serovar Pyrogenes str. L0374 TaxID=1049928 RepID=M6KEF9_LEPIR|nr:hypothetical protein LEP1GSC083_1905 [Leptospira interrogans serovar Pyrogenes str. L0374]